MRELSQSRLPRIDVSGNEITGQKLAMKKKKLEEATQPNRDDISHTIIKCLLALCGVYTKKLTHKQADKREKIAHTHRLN